jgi:hypothetical protein
MRHAKDEKNMKKPNVFFPIKAQSPPPKVPQPKFFP